MDLRPFEAELRDRYLRHLGLDLADGHPSADGLRAVQRAQLDRVPYENLEIQLGRRTTIDPGESACRIVTGRGGYCYHLNGALAGLLVSLGYDVTLVRGAVPEAGPDGRGLGNHLVLLVLLDGTTWIADAGLGDGFRDPVRLESGNLPQAPFRYRLEHSGGLRWRFHHDERASIAGFEFDVTPVPLAAFEAKHRELSTSPESGFVQKLVVQARRADHTLTLRGCVLTRLGADGTSGRDVVEEREWYAVLSDEFGLRLTDVDPAARAALWRRVHGAHQAWDRAGRP